MSLDSIYQTRGDITSPNLKSVMAKLATYNPQQLQAFAAAHEDDPIMLSAAQAVHANHEKFAQAKMAQQGGQMPPVNQQVVQNMGPTPPMPPQGGQGMPPQGMPPQGGQGMPPQGGPQASGQLPEQQGIAQLPAPNMQNMAGGGIVAFADGGYTDEDMMDSSEPVLRMADGGHVPRYQGVPMAMGGDGNLVMDPDEFTGIDEQIAARKKQMELEGAFDDYSKPTASAQAKPKARATQPSNAIVKPQDYRLFMNSLMPEKSVDPLAAERTQVSQAKTQLAEQNLADYNADMEKLGPAGVKQEERIGKREAGLEKQKNLNFDMALIEAGLGMMQSKGRGLSGLAEGAGVGLKAYTSGLERLRLAQEKIDDARDGLDTLRRNEAFMTARDRRALKSEVNKTVLSAKEDMFKGAEQAYLLDRADVNKYFDAAMKAQEGAFDRASREKVAQTGADALMARANAANSPADKHAALLVKVQNALNADKQYQEAAKFAKFKGDVGDQARATIEARKREIYRLLAPELLESYDAGKANPLAGSGSGAPLAPISSFYTKPK
jgi:hypothetical protein